MKHVVVDLEMNNIAKKSEARRICTNETNQIKKEIILKEYETNTVNQYTWKHV